MHKNVHLKRMYPFSFKKRPIIWSQMASSLCAHKFQHKISLKILIHVEKNLEITSKQVHIWKLCETGFKAILWSFLVRWKNFYYNNWKDNNNKIQFTMSIKNEAQRPLCKSIFGHYLKTINSEGAFLASVMQQLVMWGSWHYIPKSMAF